MTTGILLIILYAAFYGLCLIVGALRRRIRMLEERGNISCRNVISGEMEPLGDVQPKGEKR